MAIGLVGAPGKGGLLDRLKTIFSRAQDISPLVSPIKTLLTDANRERTLKGLDFTGRPYIELRPATIADRQSQGLPVAPPMARHGVNSRLITACEIVVTPGKSTIRITKSWPTLDWLEDHVNGTSSGMWHGHRTKGLPVRNPLGWSPTELAEVRAKLPKFVTLGVY